MRFTNRRSKRNAEISMLNLIDVIFMLLIFFMITTTFNNYAQFHLAVPKSDTKIENNKNEQNVEVIIDKDMNYFLKIGGDIKSITPEDLKTELSKLSPKLLESVTLTADEHLEYGTIVNVMGRLKDQNVKNVNLNIQKNNK